MVDIDITPLAYERVNTTEWLEGYHPYHYQWEAFCLVREALETKQTLCLFLVTPTGSGKTLGAYAHSILTGEPMMGAYPTNELLADQERALKPEFERTRSNEVVRVDSKELDRLQSDYDLTRHSETLEVILRHQPVLLTNPDILFYVGFGLYPSLPALRERLWTLMGLYRLFVFDEFHLYNIKQQADVAFIVGALHAINPNRGRVFIFASATPDLEMVSLLRDKLQLRVKVVEAQPSVAPTARTIAHPLHLSFMPADLNHWQGLAALDENWGAIESLRQQHSAGRWVTIFDSVAAAIMAAQRFRARFGNEVVGEVHGLSSETARKQALAKQVTVGTSTIEVGVDFKGEFEKDFLLFEARTSSQFLQRIGRLARHAKTSTIPNHAIAFVPEYVCNYVREKLDGTTHVSREQIRDLIEETYRHPESFHRFLKKHAAVEMGEAAKLVLGMFHPDNRPQIEERFSVVIEQLTSHTLPQAYGRRRGYREEEILTPLLTFRGAGLEAGLLDERGEDAGFPAKRYDLMFLMRRGQYEEIADKTFQEALERIGAVNPDWCDEVKREQRFAKVIESPPDKLLGVFGFFRLTGLLDKARRVWFEIDQENVMGKQAVVTVLEGLTLVTDPPAPTRLVNKILERKRIVAWLIDSPPSTIKFGRALPPLFAVYELHVNRIGGQSLQRPWSITFNQDAFFLDSLWWRESQSRDAIII